MKKSILLIMLLLVCACLVLVACDEDKPSTQPTDTSAETSELPDQTDEVDTTAPETEAHIHAFCDWTITKEPTCTEQGEQKRTCDCGEAETQAIDALGHTETVDAAVAPDCTNTGLTEGKHCSVCNEVLVAQTVVDGLGHTDGEWVIAIPATVTEDGKRHQKCVVCAEILREELIPATGSVGLAYTVNSDGKTCTITDMGTCTDTEVCIPATIDGYSVTAIGEKAFAEYSSITFIKIPDTIKTIGRRAFYNCTGITEITIPESVTDIGTQIFYGCDQLTTVYYNSSYGNYENAFLSVKNLETIIFDGKSVPSDVAYEASNLKTVVISDSVTSIGDYAFYSCDGLSSITIPDSVTSIGYGAFGGCSSLTSITVADNNPIYHDAENCLIKTKNNILIAGCNTSVIPTDGSVKSIGDYAFYGCDGLSSITIPDSVKSIGDYAFSSCDGLSSITIPDSVKSIGYGAFLWCTSLKSITIPFIGAEQDGTSNTHFGYIFGLSFDSYNSPSVSKLLKTVVITGGESIDDYAFYGWSNLTSITIPDSVKSIGDYAFYWCNGLTSITIPNGVTSIGDDAFLNCTGLTNITIPDSVTSIGSSAFRWCTGLTDVYYTGTEEEWTAIEIGSRNSNLEDATIHYNCTSEES